jgi:hypothetical protein
MPRMAVQVRTTNAAARNGRRLKPALWVVTSIDQDSPMAGKSIASVIEG